MRSLSDTQVESLRELFKTGKFTRTELAKKFNCSVTTVCLWLPESPQIRINKFRPRIRSKQCYKCGEELKNHPKCKRCEILLHGECDCYKPREYFKYY